jgi:conjugative transfer pilus assembly protein TraH
VKKGKAKGSRELVAVILTLAFLLNATACWATLEAEMQGLFDTMTNITNGGYHKGMGRGTVAGPSAVMRGNRVRTDLFNFVPPSINAGCGGIDMFMGSFSFIDADHFVNLMQAVATNAAGYAFKLALETMCPTCGQAITSLQRAMQALNATAGDSCRIAESAVNFMADKMGTKELGESMKDGPLASAATAVGNTADAFTGFLDQVNKGSSTENLDENQIKAILGNAAWKVLQRNGYMGSAFLSGDNDLAEALMSVTGTVTGVKNSDSPIPEIKFYEPRLSVKDILEGATPGAGGKPKKYHCINSDCTAITDVEYDFKGLQRMVNETLQGAAMDDGPDSFIFKLTYNSGTLTEKDKQLIRVAPYHMTRLRNMAVCAGQGNLGSLPEYSQRASRAIALEVLEHYLKDALASIGHISQNIAENIGGTNFANGLIPKYRDMLAKVSAAMRQERAALGEKLTTDLEQIYQSALKNCDLKPVQIVPNTRRQ